MTSIEAVDIFCGAGGLTRGLTKAGVRVRLGVDIDPACAYPFERNNDCPFLQADISAITGPQLLKYISPSVPFCLAGCAPCQPFSSYTQGLRQQSDYRWSLLDHFGRLVQSTKPTFVTMENVPQLMNHSIWHTFLERLSRLRFHVTHQVVHCPDYGIPQARRRLVLLASRLGPVSLIPPTHRPGRQRTVRDALRALPAIRHGSGSQQDPLHRASKLSPTNLRRIKASRPGGTWKDWPRTLRADCHRQGEGLKFSAVYGRMEWDRPAPTITTECYLFGSGRFGHPSQDRAISLREAALLQTFPRSYRFFDPHEPIPRCKLGELIGNAVPVRLGHVVGKSLLIHLKQHAD